MIKPKQVKMVHGRSLLLVEYDGPFPGTRTLSIDMNEVRERLRQASQALGRKPSWQDLKDVLSAMVKEARKKKQLPELPLDVSSLLGVDLEGEG